MKSAPRRIPAAKSPALPALVAAGAPLALESDYVLEQHIGHLLRRAHQRHVANFEKGFGPLDLTPTQFAALAKIGERGEVSQNLLGRQTAMDPATIQGVIQRLMARELIERRADPSDRRATLLRLTAAGLALTRKAIAKVEQVSQTTLAPLDARERANLALLLQKLSGLA
jgi:MarR family transcriptional regulator, lower aerobic nicotinate degradation pathway regulator